MRGGSAPKHAAGSAEEESAQTAGRLGRPVSGRVQRALHGLDLETDAGPVPVLPGPAGQTRAGWCPTLEEGGGKKKTACMFGAAVRFTGLQRFNSYVTFVFAVYGNLCGSVCA